MIGHVISLVLPSHPACLLEEHWPRCRRLLQKWPAFPEDPQRFFPREPSKNPLGSPGNTQHCTAAFESHIGDGIHQGHLQLRNQKIKVGLDVLGILQFWPSLAIQKAQVWWEKPWENDGLEPEQLRTSSELRSGMPWETQASKR